MPSCATTVATPFFSPSFLIATAADGSAPTIPEPQCVMMA